MEKCLIFYFHMAVFLIFYSCLYVYSLLVCIYMQLSHIDELRKIQDWKLEHLMLEGNDVCDKFRDNNAYIR